MITFAPFNKSGYMRYILCTILLPLFLYHSALGQDSDKNMYTEAESFLLYEEYADALPLFLELKTRYPENYNLDYKIGKSYLYIPYQKSKAISYLKRASNHISEDYKGKSLKETKAPADAIYYLGRAFHINNEFTNAIQAYEQFLRILDEQEYDKELVQKQIESCLFAKKQIQKPIQSEFINLGNIINNRFAQTNPVLSGNGKHLVFTSKLQFYDAIFFSSKTDDGWTAPRNIIPELKVDDNTYPTSLSFDGNELYLYKLDNYDGNIYVSKLASGSWQPPVKLNDNINTKYWESHASVSRDGKTLFFTSNRPGGFGELDIYYSVRKQKNEWEAPVNAGKVINSSQNDDTPFITMNNERLYFSSLGHTSMGGYDIFFVEKNENGDWKTPVNMGYPVNSTDDDVFFHPTDNGNFGYMSKIKRDGFGLHDIYEIDLFAKAEPLLISVKTRFRKPLDDHLNAMIIRTSDNKIMYEGMIASGLTEFTTTLPPATYKVIVDGIHTEKEESVITLDNSFKDKFYLLEIDPKTIKETNASALSDKKEQQRSLKLQIDERNISINDDGTVHVKMNLTKNTTLRVVALNNGDVLAEESFLVDKDEFIYRFDAAPGENSISFALSDNQQKTEKTLKINYQPESNLHNANQQLPNHLRLIVYDLVEISHKPALDSALLKIPNEAVSFTSLDEIYQHLLLKSMTYDFTTSDVDLLMERYTLSLIRYYESETLKDLLKDRLSVENENITSEDVTNSFSELNTLLYAISRIVTENNISAEEINSYLTVIIGKDMVTDMPANHSELALFGWLETVFNDTAVFATNMESRASAMSLLEMLIISRYLDNLMNVTSDSLRQFFSEVNDAAIRKILVLKDRFSDGVRNDLITWHALINTLLQINRQFNSEVFEGERDESIAVTEKTQVKNTKSIILFVIGGILFIFILVFLIRKRRKKQNE